MQELIIIRGYPGSGKTTLGKALAVAGEHVFIDHNEILTFISSYTGNDEGIYNEISALELAMTQKLLRDGKSVIVARGFSKIVTMSPYIALGSNNNCILSVLRLGAPIELLAKRVQSPTRAKDYNPTKSEDSLRSWINQNQIEDYNGESMLDASLSIERLVEQVHGFQGM